MAAGPQPILQNSPETTRKARVGTLGGKLILQRFIYITSAPGSLAEPSSKATSISGRWCDKRAAEVGSRPYEHIASRCF